MSQDYRGTKEQMMAELRGESTEPTRFVTYTPTPTEYRVVRYGRGDYEVRYGNEMLGDFTSPRAAREWIKRQEDIDNSDLAAILAWQTSPSTLEG